MLPLNLCKGERMKLIKLMAEYVGFVWLDFHFYFTNSPHFHAFLQVFTFEFVCYKLLLVMS